MHILFDSPILFTREFTMVGVVVTEPLTGNFFECTDQAAYKGSADQCATGSTSKTVTDSIFVGTSVEFEPGIGATDTVLFLDDGLE